MTNNSNPPDQGNNSVAPTTGSTPVSTSPSTPNVVPSNGGENSPSVPASQTPQPPAEPEKSTGLKGLLERNQDMSNRLGDTIRGAKNLWDKVSTAAINTVKNVKIFIAIVANPVTWVIILAFILILDIFTAFQIIGQNENADGCAGVGDSKLLPNGSSSKNSINVSRQQIGDWLMSTNFGFLGDKPMTKNQAAAFVGNWQHESAGLNSSIGQSNFLSANATNDDVIAVEGTGRAVGLVQWDGGRRIALAKFANEKGKKWSDLGLQLEFIKKELDGSYGKILVSNGFDDKTKTVTELVDLVNEYYEISGDRNWRGNPILKQRRDQRVKYAKEFEDTFKIGKSVKSGGSCLNDSSIGNSGLVDLAISVSLRSRQAATVDGDDPNGGRVAKQEYKNAKKAAEEKSSDDTHSEGGQGDELYASCDRFVATIIKNTADPGLPWGAVPTQRTYLEGSSKWEKYTNQDEAKAGDIWITEGHIMLFIGKIDGIGMVAQASHRNQVAYISAESDNMTNFYDNMQRKYVGFRYVGEKI